FRIEPGEIESKLAALDGVGEAVVLAREDETGDKRLIAYYTGSDDLTAETLRTQLARELPDYMVPVAYVRLEALPLTPNGKLDRKVLPAPEGDAYSRRAYEEPLGQTEQTLASIWAELLKVDKVGRHDNFFDLGGHSLLAITLIERMRRQGMPVDVRTLFIAPTLAELAGAIAKEASSVQIEVPANLIPEDCAQITPELLPLVKLTQAEIDRIVETVPGGVANVEDIYPLAPLQEGIFFHYLMARDGDAYQLPSVLAFDSKARLESFVSAMQSVINRHDILRTAILWEGLPEPVQVVWRSAPLQWEELTLSSQDPVNEMKDHLDPGKHRIDIRQAPLVRAYIAEDKANGSWLLGLLNHHLAIDHTTLEIIVEEIDAHRRGEEHRLPAPIPFRNFVAQARLGVSRKEHETFFREMLGTIDEPTAPFGLLDVQGDQPGIVEARLELESTLSRRLRKRARALGVSPASLCHLAWAQVLGRLTGREDVVFGTVLFGRMQGGESTGRAVGLFINTLPVRITVGDDPVAQAVRNTHMLLARLLHHEHAPLSLTQRCSAVPPPAPLFTTFFNYRYNQGDNASNVRLTAWEGVELLYSAERTNYPLALSVDDFGESFGLCVQAREPIDPQRVCGYMHTALEYLMNALEQTPQKAVRSIEVMSESERQQLLYDWNATKAAYPRDKCIHELFEEQAQKTPEAVAVVYEDKRLTYGELNEQANRLAHHLIALGVGPDSRVAIGVERGLEMVVGLLAILKAGGAYVPLDPAYPAQRLQYMLQDSAPMVLLTQQRLREYFGSIPEKTAVIELDGDGELWSDLDAGNIKASQLGLRPHHLAYVIYTSGSTGKPKGVMVEHSGLVNLAQEQ
ncbi:MAG TPA: AMP-binding protein, partial [Gammaproteobacteria bacterium]|nr:AMP-binding protein [Gammaproteobacteria bacterium]